MPTTRYAYDDLLAFATALGTALGLAEDRAETHARMLLEADLMGHSTHGLAIHARYLRDLQRGRVVASGEPEIVSDRGAALVWDGNLLPGTWLMTRAIEEACVRLAKYPMVAVCVKRSGHIGSLASYLTRATERGYVITIMKSDPARMTTVPFGGIEPRLSTNPMAFGIPTDGDPILVDISASTTAIGSVRRHQLEGTQLPGPWLLDSDGVPSDQPAALFSDPPGSLLPLGGIDLGYKGYGLALVIEALTAALSGFGRADAPSGQGSPVFLQLIDPDAFGGGAAFARETGWLARSCREARVRPGDPPVRLPGERGLALKREQLDQGVALYPSILPALERWAKKFDVSCPQPVSG